MKKAFAVVVLLIVFSTIKTFSQENKSEVAENNKKIVVEFYQKLFGDKDVSVIGQFIVEDYIQHIPAAAVGRKAIKDLATVWLANQPNL